MEVFLSSINLLLLLILILINSSNRVRYECKFGIGGYELIVYLIANEKLLALNLAVLVEVRVIFLYVFNVQKLKGN